MFMNSHTQRTSVAQVVRELKGIASCTAQSLVNSRVGESQLATAVQSEIAALSITPLHPPMQWLRSLPKNSSPIPNTMVGVTFTTAKRPCHNEILPFLTAIRSAPLSAVWGGPFADEGVGRDRFCLSQVRREGGGADGVAESGVGVAGAVHLEGREVDGDTLGEGLPVLQEGDGPGAVAAVGPRYQSGSLHHLPVRLV